MPSCCSVPLCSSSKSGHKFPRDPILRTKWLKAIRRQSYTPSNYSRVCRQHFTPYDYKAESSSPFNANFRRRLKKYAVPSVFHWNTPSLSSRTDSKRKKEKEEDEMEGDEIKSEKFKSPNRAQCRACLDEIYNEWHQFNLTQTWEATAPGAQLTVAEHLNRIANIQITDTDSYSKLICTNCLLRIKDAVAFITMVQKNDEFLKHSYESKAEVSWPQPILVNKSLEYTTLDIEIKQEVLSDDECKNIGQDVDMEQDTGELKMDIKIEPEEIQEDNGIREDNGVGNVTKDIRKDEDVETRDKDMDNCNVGVEFAVSNNLAKSSENDLSSNNVNNENNTVSNDVTNCDSNTKLLDKVKEEKMSDDECEVIPDLPLDCMLCMKSFRSVSGLKAHVIAQHSYGTVSRSTENMNPVVKKYYCSTCNRSFLSHTDLIVHETCHGKQVCYACNAKFDTFEQLTNHRKKCKMSSNVAVTKLKTLEDVRRHSPEIQPVASPQSENKSQDSKDLEDSTKHEALDSCADYTNDSCADFTNECAINDSTVDFSNDNAVTNDSTADFTNEFSVNDSNADIINDNAVTNDSCVDTNNDNAVNNDSSGDFINDFALTNDSTADFTNEFAVNDSNADINNDNAVNNDSRADFTNDNAVNNDSRANFTNDFIVTNDSCADSDMTYAPTEDNKRAISEESRGEICIKTEGADTCDYNTNDCAVTNDSCEDDNDLDCESPNNDLTEAQSPKNSIQFDKENLQSLISVKSLDTLEKEANDMKIHLEIHSLDKTNSMDVEMKDNVNSETNCDFILSDLPE